MTTTKKRGVKPPCCGFTGKGSSVTQKHRIGLCAGADLSDKVRSQQVFVGCMHCNVWRCAQCYSHLCKKIVWRNMVSIDVLEVLKKVDWQKMADNNGNILQLQFPLNFRMLTAKWNTHMICYQWKDHCPSCYDYSFLPPTRVLPSEDFESLRPKFEQSIIDKNKNSTECHYFWNCPIVSDVNGSVITKKICLIVHTILPLITAKKGKLFYFRSMEEEEHKSYDNISEHNRLMKSKYDKGASMTFVAVRIASDNGTYTDSDVPSIILLDAFEDLLQKGTEEIITEASRDLLVSTRDCVPERMPGTVATINKKKLIKKSLRKSCLKVGRKSGPHGHLGGKTMKYMRQLCTSNMVLGAIPRNGSGTICIPYHAGKKSTLATSIRTYYIKVNDQNKQAACSPLSAPPKWGWIVDAIKLHTDFHDSEQNSRKKRVRAILQREITTIFSSAMVINEYNTRNPSIFMGKECTKNTLELYSECVIKCRKNGSSLIDALVGLGRHSVVLDSTFGHQDSSDGKQTSRVKEYFQSKIVLLGGGRSDLKLESFQHDGTVPPGVLAMPRYKIFTNCMALQDMEIHGMTNIVHGSSRQSVSDESRGAWFYCQNTKTCKFFPAGCAITRILK
jgi:hypothetical protein